MAANTYSRGFSGAYNAVPNFYSGYKVPASTATSSSKNSRPNSAGTKRPSGSGYAANNPNTIFYSDKKVDDPRLPRQGSNGGSSAGGSNRPLSAGTNRSSSDQKKRSNWNGAQTQPIPAEKNETQVPISPPGYARPKSASMGRSKSQGTSTRYSEENSSIPLQPQPASHVPQPYLNQKDRTNPAPVLNGRQSSAENSQFPQQPARPNVDQYANPNDRWTSTYRLQYGLPTSGAAASNGTAVRPHSGSSNPQLYQRNGGKEVILDENISFQGINLANNAQVTSFDSGGGVPQGTNGNTASSRIRAAINLGNQYNQQVKQKTQVIEDVVAVTKEREAAFIPSNSGAVQQSATGYAEMRPRMIKSPTPPQSTKSNRHNETETTDHDDGIDIDDHEQNMDDEDDDIMGEGREMEGIGTEEGGALHKYDSRSYGHTTNPEVSTPSLSIELGQQSSLSAHLHHNHNSIDIRNGSSSLEEIPAEYNFKLSTLPNQFCSMKEAIELQKIIISCRTEKPPVNGPAAAALMDMYMVGKIVGVGSYGKVRAAWHRLTSSKVAIKTYDKSKLKDPEHWKRVQSEIKIMEQVSHPRIARLYEAVETPKRMHLIMECLDGGNLCSYVKSKKRLSEDESRRIFFQLVQALDYLHQHCIIHRDIKLENVLFDKNKDIKLIDFGFSTVSPDGKKLKVFCGTPSYMAPEIVRRTEYEGKPVDIWGLGILLYALLCGCFPFRAKTYPDLYRRIARGSFTIPDELSSPVRDLIRQLLTVDAYTRITSGAILRHPWLHSQLASAPDMNKLQTDTAILISNHPIEDINDGIIHELTDFGVHKDDVVRHVMSKTHSSLSTLYYLLLHTLKGDGHRYKNHPTQSQSQSGLGQNNHHVVSSGNDVTRKYSNAGASAEEVNGVNIVNGRPQFRPQSASANRPIPQPVLSQQPQPQKVNRPRSASAGRGVAHKHYQ